MLHQIPTRIGRKLLHLVPISLRLKVQFWYSQYRARLLGPNARAVLTSSWNGDLLIGISDLEVGRFLAFNGEYDREKIEALLALITPESDVLIVGAHIGSVLIPLARKAHHVVGVEANPQTFVLLELNIRLNALTNVELYQRAAGEEAGEVRFLMNRHNTGGSKVVRAASTFNVLFTYDQPEIVTVPSVRLDDLLGDRHFDLIVMDIEGSESSAMQGMPRLLHRCSALQIEISRVSIEKVAGIKPERFLDPLKDVFDSARINEAGVVKEYARGSLDDLLRSCMNRPDASFDVLFRKRPA